MIHPVYMPFTREALRPHFLNEKYIDELDTSARQHGAFMTYYGQTAGMSITSEVKNKRQMERDERFWTVCALKALFDEGLFTEALAAAFGETPPIDSLTTWAECVGRKSDQFLYFEVGLTSPQCYRDYLRNHYRTEGVRSHLVPYIRDAAMGRTDFEGATKGDAIFGNSANDFRVMFESKLLSDISCDVQFDPSRNQLARNMDVVLDNGSKLLGDQPSRRLLCLLTPKIFRDDPTSRYYGLLFDTYKKNPARLAFHLRHRHMNHVQAEKATRQLGWLTFEECNDVCPSACQWLHP